MKQNFRRALALAVLCALLTTLAACGGPAERQARHEKRGQAFLDAGNLDKARVEFRNALQIAPNSSQVRYENGLVAELQGNIQEAARDYVGAIDINSDNVAARARLGRLLALSGLPDEALQRVEPALAKHPDNVDLLIVRATALSLKKDSQAALGEAQRALKLSPDNEEVISAMAAVQLADGDMENAVKGVRTALARNPQSVPLQRILVEVCFKAKEYDCAEQGLLQLIRLRPHEKVFRLQLAHSYVLTKHLDEAESSLRAAISAIPEDAELKANLAEFLWAQRGPELAESELKHMIEAAPHEPALHFTLARFYEQSNDLPRAEKEYRDLIASGAKGTDGMRARDRLAAIYTAKDDLSGAGKLIAEVLDENPGDNDALLLRAGQELTRKQPEAAITDLRRLLRDQPNSLPVLLALTSAYVADGDPQLAEDAARRAVQVDPSSATARVELARALIRTGKFEQGRTVLYELDKDRPDEPAVIDLIYRASVALNDVNAARTEATQLLKIRPNSGMGQLSLGILAESAGHVEEALSDYREAFQLQPHAAEPLKAMVLLLTRGRRFKEAVALLDQVIGDDPRAALAPTLKGQVLLAQGGRLDEAEAAFRLASERSPKWWDPRRGLALVELHRRDSDRAAGVLKSAVMNADLSEGDRLELADLLTTAGRPEEAIAQYETVLKAKPKSELASAALAMLLVSYRTDEPSLSRADTLVRPLSQSTDWRLLDAFGWVHLKNKDVSAALPALERASAARPDAAQVRFHLGMAQLRAGQSDQAEKNLAEAVSPGNPFLGRDEAKAVLAQLRSRRTSS